jgi:GntR family transcriptional regulator
MGAQQADAGPGTGTDHGRTIRDSVERKIRELISSGELGEDGRLPTERDLAAQLGVSRTTVRQVLDRLEHAGSVHRRRGRSGGTFATRRRVDIDFGYLAGIPAYLRAQGFRPGAHVVSARITPADQVTSDALGIAAGGLVYEVVRVRLADEVRISLEHVRIPVTLAPDLLAQPLDDSIYELLCERYGVFCVKAVERISYDAEEKPVEYSTDLFRGDRTRVIAYAYGGGRTDGAGAGVSPGPGSVSRSNAATATSAGTYSSQPSSPTQVSRVARTVSPARPTSRLCPNPNARPEKSSADSAPSSAREFAPITLSTAYAEVTSKNSTCRPAGGHLKTFPSGAACPPRVVAIPQVKWADL